MKCQNCGMHNMEENKFCQYCGAPLDETLSSGAADNQMYSQDPNAGYSYDFGMPSGTGYHQSGYDQQFGYQAAGNPPVRPAKKRGNGLGIASLVCGIIALVLFWVFIPAWILGPAAIVLGIVQCCKRRNKGFGIAGIILGAVAFILSIILFIAIDVDNEVTSANTGIEVEQNVQDDENSESAVPAVTDAINLMNIGTFVLADDWELDVINSADDLYMYVPEGTDIQYISDVMTAQAFEITFADVDELIEWNKNEVATAFGVSTNAITVYVNEDYELPIIAFEYEAYDSEVALNMEIWEYHVVTDGKIAIFSSFDYVDIEDYSAETSKDCAFEAAKSFIFN